MIRLWSAISITGAAAIVALVASVQRLIADASSNASVTLPVVSAGGSLSIVGALFWLVQQFTSGRLVARRTAENEKELADLLRASQERERIGQERERQFQDIISNFWKAAHP